MTKLSNLELQSFQKAILKDYGVKLEGEELYEAAFNLFKLIQTLIKYDKENKFIEKVLKPS